MAVEQTWNLSQTPYMTDPDPDSALWLGIWLATIALLGIPLNLFVIIGTLTSKLVQKNSTDFFLANLACADTVCLLSGALHLYYVLFHDESVCQISGFSLYVSAVTSIMLPVFIAISRCVYIADERSRLISALRPLFCKTGIAMMNVFIWLSQMSYAIPLLIFDKFGFDPIGTCGVSKMPPIFGLFYFFIVPLSLATLWYFYRKLEFIVKQISLELSKEVEDEVKNFDRLVPISAGVSGLHYKRLRACVVKNLPIRNKKS
uniref:G-protein coupled receptors family 1 profile domain-containing protein n=1 Tax=Plectus sambesii TaxID=2011161 RepID=A0A914WLY7_9BILA